MDRRLVETTIQILRSFSPNPSSDKVGKADQLSIIGSIKQTSLGFNELLKREKTSNDRVHIQEARELLDKNGLLTVERKWKRGQKRSMKLTPLGAEILDVLENIDHFNKNNEEISKTLSTFFNEFKTRLEKHPQEAIDWKTSTDKKESLIALKNAGFTPEEVVQISSTQFTDLFLHHFLDVSIFLALLQSYMSIYYRFYSQLTRETENLLTEIILDQMHKQLRGLVSRPFYSLFELEEYKNDHYDYHTTANKSQHLFGSSIQLYLDNICEKTYLDIPSSKIRNEISKTLLSLLTIGKFSGAMISDWQNDIQKRIETMEEIQTLCKTMKEKGYNTQGYAYQNVNIDNLKEVQNIYREYLTIKEAQENLEKPHE